MRIKFKIALLVPLSFSLFSCSGSEKITFQCGDNTFTTYYDDSYFHMTNDEMHEQIALASHAMALATFNGDEDYSKRSYYLRDLWKKEGFTYIWFNDSFYQEPGTDTIGFGVAAKEINLLGGKFTLIATAVRGGNYGAEWTSNLTIGNDGNAAGFDKASDTVIEGIANFIDTYDIKGHVKFWISGYSRAAITSNMVAGKLLTKMNHSEFIHPNVHYNKNDFYAYCFEPPMGVDAPYEEATSDLYQGIHNFLNYNDFVPLVAPSEWGFVRYGTDHYYPDRLNDINFDETEREKMISLYHFTYGAQNFPKYTVDEWQFFDVGEEYAKENNLPRESINPSQGRFSRDFIHELAVDGFQSRSIYSTFLEQGIRDMLKTVMGKNEDIKGIDTGNMVNIIFEYPFIRDLISELYTNNSDDFAMDVEMLFLQLFGANEENIDKIKQLYYSNFLFFTLLAEGLGKRQDITAQLLYRDNAMNIAIGHMPELSYAFLSSCDSRFLGSNACKMNDGSYQILHLTNPTNFTIVEKTLHKDIFNYKEGKMSSSHLSAQKYNDGSIDIYLPNNGLYEYIGVVDELTLYEQSPLGTVSLIKDHLPLEGNI